jgi:hypothetical protein
VDLLTAAIGAFSMAQGEAIEPFTANEAFLTADGVVFKDEILGLPRFRGQVDRSHAMTLRLSIDDQPNQDQAPVHASAEAGGY